MRKNTSPEQSNPEQMTAEAITEGLLEAEGITPSRPYFTYHDIVRIGIKAALAGMQTAQFMTPAEVSPSEDTISQPNA